MCGIAGIFDSRGIELTRSLLDLLEKIAYRGTSRGEIAAGPGWALGANRLPIVGRDTGRQPASSADGQVMAVLNGEIYNYASLRRELEGEGCRFATDCDTEVIAQGYRRWGSSVFARLDGMFAIIVVDLRNGSHMVARDALGVKPLYWIAGEFGTCYASEIKALIGLAGEIEGVRPGHLWHSRHGLTPIRPASVAPMRWLPDNLKAHAEKLRALIEVSVRKRVATDLPVAVFLSGGIDSSAVMYEAARAHPDVVGFSIGAKDSPDVASAQRLCAELDLPHRHISVTKQELLDLVPEVISTIESFEPNHIRGGTLSYVLSREVSRAGYRVALCGEGADELFGGYAEIARAIASELPDRAVEAILQRFVIELNRTQLQRVDRTSMRFALEMREPLLDAAIIAFAAQLPLAQKVAKRASDGRILNKRVLREAYRGILPDWLVDRDKAVLSLGAGFGSNGPEGPFYWHALELMGEAHFEQLRTGYPEFMLRDREEAYYFSLFLKRFGNLSLARNRPLVNASEVEAS